MIFYPQLTTEALVQYPMAKRLRRRAIRNVLPDGSTVEVADFRDAQTLWTLEYTGLSETERGLFGTFLNDVEGGSKTFVFVEPGANLLRATEHPGQAPWLKDPLLDVVETPDLLSGFAVNRIVNGAQSAQALRQAVAAPGFYRYCFSLQLRAAQPCAVRLRLTSGSGVISTEVAATPEWRQHALTGSPGGTEPSVQCEVEGPAGAIFEVAHLQLEAASSPSAYQRNGSRSNIYPLSRIQDERIRFRADGVDNHAVTIQIVSREVPE